MEAVIFKNGKYGLRKLTFWGFQYYDFNAHVWLDRSDLYHKYIENCQVSKETIIKHIDTGTPVVLKELSEFPK